MEAHVTIVTNQWTLRGILLHFIRAGFKCCIKIYKPLKLAYTISGIMQASHKTVKQGIFVKILAATLIFLFKGVQQKPTQGQLPEIMIQQMHLLLCNSIIPMGQRIVITLGHNTNFYKEFYDLHYKLVKDKFNKRPNYSRGRKHMLFYFSSLHLPSLNTLSIWHIKAKFSKKL